MVSVAAVAAPFLVPPAVLPALVRFLVAPLCLDVCFFFLVVFVTPYTPASAPNDGDDLGRE